MTDAAHQLPDDLASAHAMILAERAARREAEALAARAEAVNSDALIARLRLEIEKLKHWDGFTSILSDGRICLTNHAAERALRGFARGRKAWLFAGSDRVADRAAFKATLIMSAKLNDIDPQAWLADVLARITDTSITSLEQLLPWNGQPPKSLQYLAA